MYALYKKQLHSLVHSYKYIHLYIYMYINMLNKYPNCHTNVFVFLILSNYFDNSYLFLRSWHKYCQLERFLQVLTNTFTRVLFVLNYRTYERKVLMPFSSLTIFVSRKCKMWGAKSYKRISKLDWRQGRGAGGGGDFKKSEYCRADLLGVDPAEGFQ